MSNTPTDDELKKLAEECGIGWGAGLGGMNDFLSAFASAVLAKWGTPQPVVREPLTNEQMMEVFNEAMKRCDENLNLPWRVAILEQVEIAHGIKQKGGQHVGKVD